MTNIVILPIIVPIAFAAVCLLVRRQPSVQKVLATAAALTMLVIAVTLYIMVLKRGILVAQVGGWPAPFGIIFAADRLSAVMVVLAAFMGLLVTLYSHADIDAARTKNGYYPLFLVLLAGVSGAFLTGDMFNLYVFFEVMLIASFVLIALGGEKAQMEGAIKYVAMNLLASALFLAALGILYGTAGTLNMADLAVVFREAPDPAVQHLLAMLFFTAFGIKAAVFPLFFWLPASYHTPPVAVSGIFAALLTKVGVYAIIRVFTLIFFARSGFLPGFILAIAALTMLTGVLGAVAQDEFRRILSFHSVSQIGYMIMGLGLFTPLGLAGTVYFLLHHAVVKSNLFLISGLTARLQHSFELKKMGGLYLVRPGIALLFIVSAFSLAGLPPLSGFFAKYALIKGGLDVREYAVVAVALVVSIMTLFSMAKIWNEVFWKKAPDAQASSEKENDAKLPVSMTGPVIVLSVLALVIGLATEPIISLCLSIADELLHPAQYIEAVLGGIL